MGKQRSGSCKEAASRAWRLLRLALLWARKGGVLKCRLISDLRQGIKHLTGGKHDHREMIWYGERQLSFDDTPIIRFKMNRPGSTSLRFLLPSCIKPDVVDFDYDLDGDDDDDDDIGWSRKGLVEKKVGDYYYRDDVIEEGQCEEDEMMMMHAATDFFSMQTSSTS